MAATQPLSSAAHGRRTERPRNGCSVGAHTRPHHPRLRRHPIVSASIAIVSRRRGQRARRRSRRRGGARGLTGLRAFLGSVSNHLLQHAHRPLLIIPPRTPSPGTASLIAPPRTTRRPDAIRAACGPITRLPRNDNDHHTERSDHDRLRTRPHPRNIHQPQNRRPQDVVGLARLTERAGLDRVTFMDHPLSPGRPTPSRSGPR